MVERKGSFRTKVLDEDGLIYLREPLMTIINRNSTENGAALIGRNDTVQRILHSRSKLPMPVAPAKGIFLFPTASIRNPDCVVLAFQQILPPVIPQEDGIIVQFLDRSTLYVNVSLGQFLKQYERTRDVMGFYKHLV